jgi:PAS domain S-box-containing protein
MSTLAPSRPSLAQRARVALMTWRPEEQPLWQRLLLAVVITLLATWLRISLAPATSGGRFITLTLAAALSALYGGFSAGMLSTVIGMVLVNFFMVEPYGEWAFDNLSDAFWLNLWHLITQLVVVGAIALMQLRHRELLGTADDLHKRTRQLDDTFENCATGMAHSRIDGSWIRVNQTYCDLVGYSRKQLESLNFRDITHPDDLTSDVELLARCLAGEIRHYSLDKRYLHRLGHVVWVHLSVTLIRDPQGQPDYVIAVVQDVGARKAAEEALSTSERLMRQAQSLAGLTSWTVELESNQLQTLGDSHQILNLPDRGYTGQEVLDMVHPDEREQVARLWVEGLRGQTPYHHEFRSLYQGEVRWFSTRAEFARDASGRALTAFGVTQDITARKRAELQVQRLNASLERRIQESTQELQAAYRDLESYSYAVAHDLRSPLRIINGFAQALHEDHPEIGASGQGHLRRIMSASKKMGELIDGLLQLSQYARGEVQRLPVNLSAIAWRLLEELSADDPLRQVDWEVQPGLIAQADPALMEALLQNLLHNAWKYSAGQALPRIQVFAHEVAGQTEYGVRDNGAGFDMAHADRLFQPFQRLHQTHEFDGLGIGLATARRIVQRHGGVLRAEAAPGLGASFYFTL